MTPPTIRPLKNPTTLSVLKRARKMVAGEMKGVGWGKHTSLFRSGDEWKVCALGALRVATFGSNALRTYHPHTDVYSHDSTRVAYELLHTVLPSNEISIVDYNDLPSTRCARVVALFDRAIKAAKAQGV